MRHFSFLLFACKFTLTTLFYLHSILETKLSTLMVAGFSFILNLIYRFKRNSILSGCFFWMAFNVVQLRKFFWIWKVFCLRRKLLERTFITLGLWSVVLTTLHKIIFSWRILKMDTLNDEKRIYFVLFQNHMSYSN